uniref:Uncharacterized protein n=1 Tax=viral metagenome TaxID=1070528 RepID=A0A6M3IXS5_9ZZZZ
MKKDKIKIAINDIEKMRRTHIQWAEYFEKYPDIEKKYIETGEWDNAKEHRNLVKQYDNVLNILKFLLGGRI